MMRRRTVVMLLVILVAVFVVGLPAAQADGLLGPVLAPTNDIDIDITAAGVFEPNNEKIIGMGAEQDGVYAWLDGNIVVDGPDTIVVDGPDTIIGLGAEQDDFAPLRPAEF